MKRRVSNNPITHLYFWRLSNDWEIDFIITERNIPIQALQVSYSLKDFNTYSREIRSLVQFAEQYPTCELLIITFDEEDHPMELKTQKEFKPFKKIKIIPFWKWVINS
ncbi:MAG: hypothetical protein DRO88_13575 [Promethearchaeia archaeon]|nr:MAG: hypothetical protein DRO88_13575 [Candidatus Lokiarchaeia archaeon]